MDTPPVMLIFVLESECGPGEDVRDTGVLLDFMSEIREPDAEGGSFLGCGVEGLGGWIDRLPDGLGDSVERLFGT